MYEELGEYGWDVGSGLEGLVAWGIAMLVGLWLCLSVRIGSIL